MTWRLPTSEGLAESTRWLTVLNVLHRCAVGVDDLAEPRRHLPSCFLIPCMSHFLFIAGALPNRKLSGRCRELQLGAGIWGLCTALIRDNLHVPDAGVSPLVYPQEGIHY